MSPERLALAFKRLERVGRDTRRILAYLAVPDLERQAPIARDVETPLRSPVKHSPGWPPVLLFVDLLEAPDADGIAETRGYGVGTGATHRGDAGEFDAFTGLTA